MRARAGRSCLRAIVGAAIACAALAVQAEDRAQPMRVQLDARDAARSILHARLSIPVSAGPLTLVYPRWLPGTHGPVGPMADIAGLRFAADGREVGWKRDDIDMYAIHLDVPAGTSTLDVSLDFLSGPQTAGTAAPASISSRVAIFKWNQVLLYPRGLQPDAIEVAAELLLPEGWAFATALPQAPGASPASGGEPDVGDKANFDGRIEFQPVTLTTLVDSPVLAGLHFRQVVLDDARTPVYLELAADSAAALAIPPANEEQLRRLVREADALFGARHFRRYHFLVALSDELAQFGLESHESSENRMPERTFLDSGLAMLELGLLPHEYVHSWNGKFRRPAGLATPDFQQPMRGGLLWVYEGLTQYLGNLLAVRSGLWTPERYRDRLAQAAAYYSIEPGRKWRPLLDTAVASQQLSGSSSLWRSYRRGLDYYNEGWLLWLEADMLIREQTRDRRSLDDFCRLFFGPPGGAPRVSVYDEAGLYAALGEILPWDWQGFFAERLTSTALSPLGGISAGGWSLKQSKERNAYLRDLESLDPSRTLELAYSLGLRLDGEGGVGDVLIGGPADHAGIAPGMKLVAVNDRRWSAARLREAIGSAGDGQPLELMMESGDRFSRHPINYTDGLREPHLERVASRPDRLGASLAPRTSPTR